MDNNIDKYPVKTHNLAMTDPADSYFSGDNLFDTLYSLRAQQLSAVHWTPLQTAVKAAAFLCPAAGLNILDIGSGTGKFCLAAGRAFPECQFFGIEQRASLHDEAVIAQKATNVTNAHFLLGNFNTLDMETYQHFYFYNAFSENLFHYKPIDNLLATSPGIYQEYLQQLYEIFDEKPSGTRLATFHCPREQVPPAYQLVVRASSGELQCWIKE